jgi:hypothetical protein
MVGNNMNDRYGYETTHKLNVLGNELTVDVRIDTEVEVYEIDDDLDEEEKKHCAHMFDTGRWSCVTLTAIVSWNGLEGSASVGQVILFGSANELFKLVDEYNLMPDALNELERAIVATQLFSPTKGGG